MRTVSLPLKHTQRLSVYFNVVSHTIVNLPARKLIFYIPCHECSKTSRCVTLQRNWPHSKTLTLHPAALSRLIVPPPSAAFNQPHRVARSRIVCTALSMLKPKCMQYPAINTKPCGLRQEEPEKRFCDWGTSRA